MIRRTFSITCLLFLMLSTAAVAQSGAARIYAVLGVRQNYITDPNRVLQPTLQFEKKLGVIDTAQVVVNGALYWGYWQDGISEVIDCPHCITYAHKSHIVGTRIIIHSVRQIIPLQFFAGISRQFIKHIYIGGFGANGAIGEDYRAGFWQTDAGAALVIPVSDWFVLRGSAEAQLPLGVAYPRQHINMIYNLGIGYQPGW